MGTEVVRGGEGPAAAALALVVDAGDDASVAPVERVGQRHVLHVRKHREGLATDLGTAT
jgi:hypothetical protein